MIGSRKEATVATTKKTNSKKLTTKKAVTKARKAPLSKKAPKKAAKAPRKRRVTVLGATPVRVDEHAQYAKDSLASAALMVRQAKATIQTDCPRAMEMLAQALFHQGAAAAHIEHAQSAAVELDVVSQKVRSEIKATLDAVKIRCAVPARA